ncbi:MAG: tRNA (adenosine(37)-N6)-threonylcarbamoyltransferase complex ATPase subunit type 1 TsaE [Puniceicoccales bacterium]|jgi:tRNA threonylcarbamoyladenosine biosynthesis protein TsaE|nr:tRNA (adenosine(37)-N6)-threonylcarbamoyltransferase complex ATPase subunit type 1 TsaE [Puniceicoccales bacterium]
MHELTLISENWTETQRYGQLFAENCHGNVVILLSGVLGAGKTTFIKGLAKGFGVKREISSPSFNLMNVYTGSRYKLFHIDTFREKSLSWDFLNLDDILEEPFCCAVEWAEHFCGCPEDLEKIYITIEAYGNTNRRTITTKAQNKSFLCKLSLVSEA